jgi:hypothetical protein
MKMIHVYGENVTREGLRDIPLERPKDAGWRWKGIQHGELVDTIITDAEERNWGVGESRFSVSNNGAELAGAIAVSIPKAKAMDGMELGIGILTSNARKRALSIFVGGTVSVCTNGMTTGEIVLNRQHTLRLNLREQIQYALDDYAMAAFRIPRVVAGMRRRDLAESEYEHTLLEAGRRGLMPWSRLGDVDREYRIPRFGSEFGERNSWALLNAFTWVAKRNPPRRQLEQIEGFRKLLPTVCNSA